MLSKMCLGWFEVWYKYWKVFVGLVYSLKERELKYFFLKLKDLEIELPYHK